MKLNMNVEARIDGQRGIDNGLPLHQLPRIFGLRSRLEKGCASWKTLSTSVLQPVDEDIRQGLCFQIYGIL